MKVSGQKPIELSPIYSPAMNGIFDYSETLKNVIVKPSLQPLSNSKITVSHDGKDLTEDDLVLLIDSCLDDQYNSQSEDIAKEFFGETLLHFDKTTNLGIKDLFAIQSAMKENNKIGGNNPVLPFPSSNVKYTAKTDIIPNCKGFLANTVSYDVLFASFAFFTNSETLGVYFLNEAEFEKFKTWLGNNINAIKNNLDAAACQMFSDFQALKLDGLTESILLRVDDNDNTNEYCFARTLTAMVMSWMNSTSRDECGIFPFSLRELILPKSLVFVNIEKHARANQKQIKDEWKLIENSLVSPYKILSNRQLNKLTAVQKTLQKAAAGAAAQQQNASRVKAVKFRKSALTAIDITKYVKAIVKKMAFVNKSENAIKFTKTSFSKPNRRDPDDYNKPGKIISTKYKPDIHIYLDTSGSISERNYEDAVRACIKLAKMCNVNIYFNSFSHVLSQCTKMHIKDKTVNQIYKTFQKTPKVDGGTNYEQIWHYINNNRKRRKELSLIITDFEYYPPNKKIKHPNNLYYLPCSNMNWDRMIKDVTSFEKSMRRIEPCIRRHILM